MSHARYLRELLRPLGVYDLSAPFNGSELDAQGAALDGVMDRAEEVQREASALAALLRIGGDSFTLDAINDTITGCGIPAVVKELGTGQVSVSFPGVAGEPQGFSELKKIIEDILPTHLGIEYDFWFLTWAELEENFPSWQSIETLELSWTQLETYVEYL